MRRSIFAPVWIVVLLAVPGIVSADWHEFWAQFEKDRQRNQAWPLPFNQVDQQSVRSIFGTMVRTGWEQQLVFQDIHFDSETNELNALGETKLKWVLQNVPPQRASLFIQRSLEPEKNEARLEALQLAASEMLHGDAMPPVVPSNLQPVRMPGQNADSQISAARQMAPTFLPAKSVSGASSSN